MKRLLLCISIGFITAIFLAQSYNWFVHPEISYYRNADAITSTYEKTVRATDNSCYVLAGGSETRAGFIPSVMHEESGISVINTATAAGFGLEANLALAINHLQAGDTLVLSLISVQQNNVIANDSGIKLLAQLYGAKAYQHNILPLTLRNVRTIFSSDAGSMMAYILRKYSRGYAYIYEKEASIHPDGWMEIHREGMQNFKPHATIAPDIELTPDCTDLLRRTMRACRTAHADFLVMLPVGFNNEYETKRRLMHALQLTRMGIPVLRDERLGIEVDNSLYADTIYHLNAKGATQNSRIIARLLKEKSYWTEQELLEQMKARGFTADGTPQK